MAINRRRFLAALAGAPFVLQARLVRADASQAALFSAVRSDTRGWELLATDLDGGVVFRHPLPARAHHVLLHPQKPWVVVIERRPGTRIDVVDRNSGRLIRRLTCEPGNHLFGHAQFSADGRYLITAEQGGSDAHGSLVFRDTQNGFAVQRTLDSGGVGPHEFKWVQGTRPQLLVANGGIKTRGREKINLDVMRPSLAYLDYHSGEVQSVHRFAAQDHQASIRHLDVTADGTVLLAMQFEGDPTQIAPLAAVHRPGQALQPLPMPEEIRSRLRQYCGSACIDSSQAIGAISAPRGNRILFWHLPDQTYLGSVVVRDGCGLAPGNQPGVFFASSGSGRLYRLYAKTLRKQRIEASYTQTIQWDNHLTRA
ncbi:MAG TPA: DUF1513 domain-containing protein [Gammaproteobacteria bacterium]|nr:DUF1513 domain-containing protein [Gammaproteobacteria bacterium]